MAFSVISAKLPQEQAVVGVLLCPYVLIRRGDATVTADDVPEEGSGSGQGQNQQGQYQLRSRWSRSTLTRGGAVCSVHPDREATVQCVVCLKARVPQHLTYHCTSECLKSSWRLHLEYHKQSHGNGADNGYDAANFKSTMFSNGESWVEVSKSRNYTPTPEDMGYILKYECTAMDMTRPYVDLGRPVTAFSQRVRAMPIPPTRNSVPLKPPHGVQTTPAGKFSVLTYNMLADLYAKADTYSYCPHYALTWHYRKLNLLNELMRYKADILCLQEVQSDHFSEFLSPELQKHGYSAIYKKKTAEMYTGNSYAMDGCATFFKRDKFTLVKKYEVEFNKAALSLAEQMGSPQQKKQALNRLLKDNVALIAVLEALEPSGPDTAGRGRQLICVANTHIHANPELNDVKLWQVHTLLKGLEKIAASADIPMLVAGDFNSVPGSPAHGLLTRGRVDPHALDAASDPLGILRDQRLSHQLPLSSAYGMLWGQPNSDQRVVRQKQRLSAKTHEPAFTNFTRDFKGTLDYILFTHDSLMPVSLLELPSEQELAPEGHKQGEPVVGLPNAQWSSDHVALLAEFHYLRSG